MRAFLSGGSPQRASQRDYQYGPQIRIPELRQPEIQAPLSRFEEFALATVIALSVANAYYVHPIISEVAAHFDIGAAEIGIVPAFNQIALAVGIFFLLPLGDRFGNRNLVLIFSSLQGLCLLVMAIAPSFPIFLGASTILGSVTVAPYLLPAYASKRTPPEQLGRVTALLTAGIVFGILYARVGAGVIAEHLGWQMVYYLASGLMLILVLTLKFLMRAKAKPALDALAPTPYGQLILSLLPLVKQHPEAVQSGCIQALNFGMFIAIWLGLALHLVSPQMGYSVDVVGYLALTAGLSMITTPRLGIWVDTVSPEKARLILAFVQIVAMALLYLFADSLLLLLIPILMNTVVGPVMDVSGRMTILRLAPDIRTRLMTVYVVIMFVGGGIASTVATTAYDAAGWSGNVAIAGGFAILTAILSALAYSNRRPASA